MKAIRLMCREILKHHIFKTITYDDLGFVLDIKVVPQHEALVLWVDAQKDGIDLVIMDSDSNRVRIEVEEYDATIDYRMRLMFEDIERGVFHKP